MGEKKTLNPMAMSAEEAAKTLGIPREWLDEDLADGAPTNADGTINLVHYGAWLNLQLKEDGGPQGRAVGRGPGGRAESEGA